LSDSFPEEISSGGLTDNLRIIFSNLTSILY
jgi:hypothetical protein